MEYPDIEALAKRIGASPTKRGRTRVLYTIPIISDPNTGKVVSDSFRIAEYLDATYPEGRTLFPRGTKPLIAAFDSALTTVFGTILPVQYASTCAILNPSSEAYFRGAMEVKFGRKIEELSPVGPKRDDDLAKGRKTLTAVDEWLEKSDGKFVLGDTISYADGLLAGRLVWIKATDSIWEEVMTWHNGRWATYLENLENAGYASIH